MNKRVLTNVIAVVLIIVVLFTFYMFMFANTNNDGKQAVCTQLYDSYTLQAMQWREGRIKLDKDYPWLTSFTKGTIM